MLISRSFSWRKGMVIALAASTAAMVAQQAPTQQSSAPAYKVDVKVVNVLATVRDKKGKIVNDLTQSDFSVEEDGRPQTIKYFTRDTDLPLTLGLLVDTSRSQRAVLDQERSASGTFVDSVLREDKDQAFLIHFDRQVELLQDMTKSPQKVADALANVSESTEERDANNNGGGSNGGQNDPNAGGYPGGGGGRHGGYGGQGGGYGRGGGGTHLYDSIYLASDELMAKEQGRKAIVVLTDGVDHGSKESIEQAIESAQRANTIVYSIYYKGEEGGGWNRGGGGGGGRGPHIGMGGGWPGGGGGYPGGGGGYPGGRRGGGQQPQEPRVDGKKILERISKETGGRMFEVTKKETVADIYREIQDELRNQYNIGYTPDKTDPGDEGYRKITVTAKNKDYTVQAREGYYPSRQMEAKTQGQ